MVRKLEEFKNIHKNQDIYIIASGKSLDFIDNSFFGNKITIGINQVFKKIETDYLVRKERQLLNNILNLKLKSINFISNNSCGGNYNGDNKKYILKNYKNNNNIVLYRHNENKHFIQKLPNENELIVSFSTIVTGIHLAAYMGAKNIILIGHDCGTIDGEPNFKGYHTNATYKIAHKKGKIDYIKWLREIENDTIKLKGLLKQKYGCNVYSLNPFINFGLEGHIYKK